MMRRRNTYTQLPLSGNIFGVVASTTRRDICRPTGGQEWVEIKSSMLLNTLMCGETGRISRVDNFIVELEVLSTKMMSSFDSCQVLLSLNFTYDLSLEIQKYRLQCGWIYEIMEKCLELLPTAYKMRLHFWAYAFWSSKKPLFPHCRYVLIVDAYSFVPPPAAVILPFSSSWSKK